MFAKLNRLQPYYNAEYQVCCSFVQSKIVLISVNQICPAVRCVEDQ